MDKDYIAGYSYDEWIKLENEFLNDYETSTTYNKSFGELISEILEEKLTCHLRIKHI